MAIVIILIGVSYLLFCIFSSHDKSRVPMEERSFNRGFSLNIVSMSLVIIFIVSLTVSSLPKLDVEDTINVYNFYVAFIAICTTFVVGFQIYNSIDFTRRIERLNSEKQSLEKEMLELKRLNLESHYYNAYSIGTIHYNESGIDVQSEEYRQLCCWKVLRAYFNALRFASQGGHDFSDAVNSIGNKKIVKCIEILEKIRHQYPDTLPLSDRKIYIRQINTYISNIKTSLQNELYINDNSIDVFDDIVDRWTSFMEEFYHDLFTRI